MLLATLIIIPLSLLAGVATSLPRRRARPRDLWTAAALVGLWLIGFLDWRHALSHPLAVALFPLVLALSVVAVVAAARRAGRPVRR